MPIDRNKLSKFVMNGLRRTKGAAIEVQAEIVMDFVELYFEVEGAEEGIAQIPARQPSASDAPMEWPIVPEKIEPPPAADPKSIQRASPAGEEPRLIITSDHPDFSKPADAIRVSKLVTPTRPPQAADIRGKLYWDTAELIAQISANTPPEVEFTPNGLDRNKVRIVAKRNIQNIVATSGGSIVRLEYAVPGINETEGGVAVPPAGEVSDVPVAIGLTANVVFSPFVEEQDFHGALHGEKGIIVQLKGLYSPRQRHMGGNLGPDPGPLRMSNDDPMQSQYSSRMEKNWSVIADPSSTVREEIVRSNRLSV